MKYFAETLDVFAKMGHSFMTMQRTSTHGSKTRSRIESSAYPCVRLPQLADNARGQATKPWSARP